MPKKSIVKVLNATAEPDGLRKSYYLRVSPDKFSTRSGSLDLQARGGRVRALHGNVNTGSFLEGSYFIIYDGVPAMVLYCCPSCDEVSSVTF